MLIPAKCGNSPLLKVGMVLSSIEDAPGSPISIPRFTSSSCLVVGMVASSKFHDFYRKERRGSSQRLFHKFDNSFLNYRFHFIITYLLRRFPPFGCLWVKRTWMVESNLLGTTTMLSKAFGKLWDEV